MDPMNTVDGQKPQSDDKQDTPVVTTPAPQPENKVAENGNAGEGSDDSGSEVDSESDEETDTEAEEPDCRVIVNVSPPTKKDIRD